MLVEHGASLDIVCQGKSLLFHIEEKMPDFNISSIRINRAPLVRETSMNTTERLFSLVDKSALHGWSTRADIEEFTSIILQMDVKTLTNMKSGGLSLLQKCCAGGLSEFVDGLLGEGLDPNYCPAESLSAPVLLAAYRKVYQLNHKV